MNHVLTVRSDSDGRLTVDWPLGPKPPTVEISVELLEQMIDQHNRSITAGQPT